MRTIFVDSYGVPVCVCVSVCVCVWVCGKLGELGGGVLWYVECVFSMC